MTLFHEHEITAEQGLALYLYSQGKVDVRLSISHRATCSPDAIRLFDIVQDFNRAVFRDKKLSDCYDRARTALFMEPK